MGLGPTGVLATPGTPVAPVSAAVTHAAQAAVAGHAIDNRDKSAVAEAYQSRWKDNLDTPSGWVGSVDLCVPGTITPVAQDAVHESINFVRAMAGLDAVGFADGLSSKAQEAALLMDANNSLSHDPPSSWDCWTKAAADAAGHSNLAITTGTMDAGESVELYMDDQGPNNVVAGHRRWLLRPSAKTFGNGMTDTASTIWVIGPTSSKKANPRWVPWPSAGWFPAGLEPHGRWSIGSGSDRANFSRASVVVRKKGGARLDVRKYKPVNGYAKPTLVFRVKGLDKTGTYVATVRGVRGVKESRHTWTDKLFD
jgi:uncharacterized protein YkwD